MGLDIYGSKSKKTYRSGYHGLHLVRILALYTCGFPEEDLGYPGFYIVPENLTGKALGNMVHAAVTCGYLYPNLMLHSDCEGSYTKKGKPLTNDWLSGNSIGLLDELARLSKRLDKKHKQGRSWDTFKMLFSLVKDEVENGNGEITFS